MDTYIYLFYYIYLTLFILDYAVFGFCRIVLRKEVVIN